MPTVREKSFMTPLYASALLFVLLIVVLCVAVRASRHFSHLLQIYDLETIMYNHSQPATEPLNSLMLQSLDNWYGITCNSQNWFNEEVRHEQPSHAICFVYLY